MQALAPGVTLVQRIANPPAFADVNPERALKVLLYQLTVP
jgi:23S rRNA (cytosine1962-C5)-methyltransferase